MRHRALARFLGASLFGLAFFLLPVPWRGRTTVLFDVAVTELRRNVPGVVSGVALTAVLVGGLASVLAALRRSAALRRRVPVLAGGPLGHFLDGLDASAGFLALRLVGALLAVLMLTGTGPSFLVEPRLKGLMWDVLVGSVAVIVPLGAAALALLVGYGALEFVGVLAEPLMRPLFRLPGRAALDDLTSWVGSYSVGLYLTRKLFLEGRYTRREAFIIATCFSTVSLGFVAVVAATLDLLPLFPLVVGTYFVAVHLVAVVVVRLPPTSRVPNTYVTGRGGGASEAERPRDVGPGERRGRLRRAMARALERAAAGPSPIRAMVRGFTDGLTLSASILGTILAVGTAALLVAYHTPLFQWLGAPLEPLFRLLGFARPDLVAQASLAGITEMYVPALLARAAGPEGHFFVGVLSVSQLIFFSSVGPMMMDMFREVPIRFRDLVVLFLLRTALLLPLLVAWTKLLGAVGLLT